MDIKTIKATVDTMMTLFDGISTEVPFGRVCVRGGKIAFVFEVSKDPIAVLELEPQKVVDLIFGAVAETPVSVLEVIH